MSLEVELKFLLPVSNADTLFASLQQQSGANWQFKAQHTLLNAYFDTADGWFRRHDIGLRTRQKNQQFEQTIKLPGVQQGAAHIRPEYNQPCADVLPKLTEFPAEIWPAGTSPAQLQSQLTELFRTDFVRRSFLLQDAAGSLELVFDQGWVLAGDQQEPIAELELELQSGDPALLFQLARRLLQHAPLLLGVQSKAERGYRLAQQQPLQRQPFAPHSPLAAQLRWFLCQQILHSQGVVGDAALADDWQQWQQHLHQQQPALAATMPAAFAAEQATQRQLWLLDLTASLIAA